MSLKPFFCYYGGKWRIAKRYPTPAHAMIIEPFAGGAGYSTRYADRQIVLVERNPKIAAVWRYLIRVSPEEILRLPDWESGTISDLSACEEARYLIGMISNPGSAHPRTSVPPSWKGADYHGSQKMCRWGRPFRERIAAQVPKIKHWKIFEGCYSRLPNETATWFVDPPYQMKGVHYKFGSAQIDYPALGDWCMSRRGQIIACENTGADWLPFVHLVDAKASNMYGKSAEAIWVQG